MSTHAEAGCLVVGDYVDEAECPTDPAVPKAEVDRPTVVANYIDRWAEDDGLLQFTVLLKDGRLIVVRGHALKHEPHPLAGQDVYGIVIHAQSEEVLVAVFKSADVAGIFHGDFCGDRKIA